MRSPISPAMSVFCTPFLTSSLTCFTTLSEISRYPRSVSLATASVSATAFCCSIAVFFKCSTDNKSVSNPSSVLAIQSPFNVRSRTRVSCHECPCPRVLLRVRVGARSNSTSPVLFILAVSACPRSRATSCKSVLTNSFC